jgi:acetyl esterase/lipase
MSRFRGRDHVPTHRPWRLRLVVGTLVGLLVMVATSSPSRADDASPSPLATTRPYGSEPHQLLDVQRPDPRVFPGPRPIVVYLHAGGWIAGDRTEVPDVLTAQVARGYVLASVDYQLATVAAVDGRPVSSFPGAVWDVKRAVRYVKANATTWGIDPDRVVLAGASAGGHLAAFVGATPGRFEPPDVPAARDARRDSSVRGIVDLVGPTDLATFGRSDHPWAAPVTAAFLGCARPSLRDPLPCPGDRLELASVAPWVDRTDPPILLAYGALDTLVVPATQGEPLAGIWRDAHGGDPDSASYFVVETAGHTLPFEDTQGPLTAFLDRVTGRATTGAADAVARSVVLYGDSLASEAQTHFKVALASAGITDVHARTFGGTALCDWLDEMRVDAVDLRPSVAVIEFSGNAFTPCMQDSSGAPLRGDAYYAKYHADAVEALRTFSATNTRVILVGAPVSRRAVEERRRDAGRLNALYASLATVGGAEYAHAGAAVLDRGRFTAALECLPAEPCTGGTDASGTPINAVRAPDGVHFCPAALEAIDGVTGECPVWSSGAFRFGTAMADSVVADPVRAARRSRERAATALFHDSRRWIPRPRREA